MDLIVAHYHLRPGGVRRVIEQTVLALAQSGEISIDAVTLACGEPPDEQWRMEFERALAPVPVRITIRRCFRYLSEQHGAPANIARAIRTGVAALLAKRDHRTVVWFHNAGLGRNLLFVRELEQACAAANIPFISHHHDWWFEHRWQRWPEMKRFGFISLQRVARTIFPAHPRQGHIAINSADAAILQAHCQAPSAWIPNLAVPAPAVPEKRVHEVRQWLATQTGSNGPIWLLPCRLLRRKNIAEALLLTRWLRPTAWLVTTGAASSADEVPYRQRLTEEAARHGWPLKLGVLDGDARGKPRVPELMASCEVALLTSLQEGFGLPFVEAAAAHRPLIARRLANIAPDLRQFGFRFPQTYDDLLIPPGLFDAQAEAERQTGLLNVWTRNLPQGLRRAVRTARDERPATHGIPFSQLSLSAQMEVLAWPAESSWTSCAPLNPFLVRWRRLAIAGRLVATPWPRRAELAQGSAAFARAFSQLLARVVAETHRHPRDAETQTHFLRERLAPDVLYPLLLATDT